MPKSKRPASRTGAADLDDQLVQSLAGALAPVELPQAERDRMRAKILARVEPPPLTYTVRFNEGQWLPVGPGVELKVLRIDRESNTQTVMFRMQPGSQIVPHPHNLEEECLVMEGEILVGEHRVGAGDMHIARPGARHPPIIAPRGALLCVRSEIPPAHFRPA